MMQVLIRVDASYQIGAGHVMRCLTLAMALREAGAVCHFVCRDLPGHMTDVVREQGFEAYLLPEPEAPQDDQATAHSAWLTVTGPQDADDTKAIASGIAPDWVIVDHYALDHVWETEMRVLGTRVMVIDDLADRKHDCDVLLDQNLGRRNSDYDSLVPGNCLCLTGPRYALLRPQFAAAREASLARRANVSAIRTMLISMGGTDVDNATGQVLDVLSGMSLPDDVQVTVVMGRTAPHLESVRVQAAHMPFQTEVKVNVSDMAELLVQTDLAIGAAGGSSWERCCLGVPTLLLTLADNQRPAARAMAEVGAVTYVGDLREAGWTDAFQSQMHYLLLPAVFGLMSRNAALWVDGKGARCCCSTIFQEGLGSPIGDL